MRGRACILALACLLLLTAPTAASGGPDAAGVLPVQLKSLLEESPGCGPCELGGLTADCVRQSAGADLAIVPAGDLENDLPVGPLCWSDVTRAVNESRRLATARISPAQLFRLLEGALSHLTVDPDTEALQKDASSFDGFPQISGFSLTVDASAPVGERVYALTLTDGTRLSRDDSRPALTLASTEHLFSGGYGFSLDGSWQVLEQTLADAVAQTLSAGTWTDSTGERIRIIGVSGSGLISVFPTYILVAALAVAGVLFILFHCKQRSKRDLLPMREGDTRRVY